MVDQNNSENTQQDNSELLGMVADVVAAYVGNNHVAINEIPSVIQSVGESLSGLSGGSARTEQAKQEPAVPPRRSVHADYIICLEDGAKMKTMKRYIMRRFGLTPAEYRQKWGLPADYPMVAPNYSKRRSEMAKELGLGQRGRAASKAAKSNNDTSTAKAEPMSQQEREATAEFDVPTQKKTTKGKSTSKTKASSTGTAKTASGKPRGGKSGKPRRTKAEMAAARAAGEVKKSRSRSKKSDQAEANA